MASVKINELEPISDLSMIKDNNGALLYCVINGLDKSYDLNDFVKTSISDSIINKVTQGVSITPLDISDYNLNLHHTAVIASNVNPSATLGGTWVLIPVNRLLYGSYPNPSSTPSTKEPKLPSISGTLKEVLGWGTFSANRALAKSTGQSRRGINSLGSGSTEFFTRVTFGNQGSQSYVIPKRIRVPFWRRTG